MVARTMALSVKPFTMIGATTRSGLLSSPLRDRFGQHYHLDFYAHADLAQIITRSAHLLGVGIDDQGMARLIRSAGFKVSALRSRQKRRGVVHQKHGRSYVDFCRPRDALSSC